VCAMNNLFTTANNTVSVASFVTFSFYDDVCCVGM